MQCLSGCLKRKHFFAAPFVECMQPDDLDSTLYRNCSACSLKVS